MRKVRLGLALQMFLLGLSALAGCGSSDSAVPTAGSVAADSPTNPASALDGANEAELGGALDRPASEPALPALHPIVEVETSHGKIKLKLNGELAAGTVRNFIDYVTSGHYNGTIFHYVDGNMILAGGFSPDMQAQPVRASIRNEAHNGLLNKRGTIAMSRPLELIDSATCEFFINVQDNKSLDHQGEKAEQYGYCVFGEVTEGMDVVDRIAELPVNDKNEPEAPVLIKSIREVY